MLEYGFDEKRMRENGILEECTEKDILDQCDALKEIWDTLVRCVNDVVPRRRTSLLDKVLKSSFNVILSNESGGTTSNSICVDYYLDLNAKAVKLDSIYSGSHIEQNEYEIDHFVPWSFVTNDEMWNLIPVNPSLNASKRDKLPNWDRYFLSFAQNQFRLNQMVYKYERLAHIFRECQRDNLNAAWSVEELYVKNIKNDQFCKVLESRLKPIYELARTQGYRIWMVGE